MNKVIEDNSFFEELSDTDLALIVGGQNVGDSILIPGLTVATLNVGNTIPIPGFTIATLEELAANILTEDSYVPQ